jgi:hypothetical protein
MLLFSLFNKVLIIIIIIIIIIIPGVARCFAVWVGSNQRSWSKGARDQDISRACHHSAASHVPLRRGSTRCGCHHQHPPPTSSVEGRQWLSLPHTTIQVQGTPLISLLDSGSEVTCINEENFITLKARDTIHTLPVSTSRLVGATGQQSSRIKWQALLEFTISDLTFTNIFLVVKNLIRPVVIGIDWLKIRSTWCWILSNRP